MRDITKKLVNDGVIKFNKKSENTYEYIIGKNFILVFFNTIFDTFIEVYKEDEFYSYIVTGKGGEEFIEFMDEENFLNRLEVYRKEDVF